MEKVFGMVLHLSLIGSYTFLLVLLLRFLMLKVLHCSRKLVYVLWLLVFLNFCVPMALQSPFSLIPSGVDSKARELEYGSYELTGAEQWMSGTDQAYDRSVSFPEAIRETRQNPAIADDSKNPGLEAWNWRPLFQILWLSGILVLLAWQIFSIVRWMRFLNKSLCVRADRKQRIREYEKLPAPFVWGIRKPAIYLPAGLEASEKRYILAHEEYHRKRRDPLWKILFLLVRTLHWFNPCIWLAYGLFCRDMEISCDEAVLQSSSLDIRKEYAASLLKYAAKQSGYAAGSLTFGEPSLKSRIRNVLNYRKKSFLLTIAGVLLLLVAALGLLVRPALAPGTDTAGFDTGTDTAAAAEHTILGNGGEMLAVDGKLYYQNGVKLCSDGQYLYYASGEESDGTSRIWRQLLNDENMEMILEGELLGGSADGSSLYYDPGDFSVWEYDTASGGTSLLYQGNQLPITGLYVDEAFVLTASGQYERSAGYFYGDFHSCNRKTGQTRSAHLTDASWFVVLDQTLYYQKYFNSPDAESVPYGIYQTDLNFQGETKTAGNMTLLGADILHGDLLASVSPDFSGSAEPGYAQTDLDAISAANSRGWNQVLVDAGAVTGYTDSVYQKQLINLAEMEYVDYPDAEITSVRYQEVNLLGDTLYVRMQFLGHFTKEDGWQDSVLRELWLKASADGKGAETLDSAVYFPEEEQDVTLLQR